MIEIKNRFTGRVIHTGGFDSIKYCLIDAVENGANLSGANLREANLSGVDLYGVDLREANLSGVDLYGANLRGANLSGVDLSGANLSEANLREANLWWCAGNKSEIKSLWFSDIYPITYTAEVLQIGCECHKINVWWEFDDKRILEMDGKTALKFWRENKELIKQIIDANPAKATGKE